MSELKRELAERARALGFARVGVARATELGEEGRRLAAWLARGYHGQMHYMETTAAVRVDPRSPLLLDGARSVVVLAAPYARAEPPRGPKPGRVARYAQGRDYHNVLGKRLRKLAAWLRGQGFQTRSAVDSMPVFERAWAVRAGVGFVGKNCCLIVPGLGSHVFLAALVTRAELPEDTPMRERCGACTRCLDACPTAAFRAPRQLDARRCVSYLTIEHRGGYPKELRSRVGDWLFGCDACQDVCPFNATQPVEAAQTEPFAPDPRWDVPISALLRMSEAEFALFANGSPLKRAGPAGLARNAAVVLGNAGGQEHVQALEACAQQHEQPAVREAARWAVLRLRRRLSPETAG